MLRSDDRDGRHGGKKSVISMDECRRACIVLNRVHSQRTLWSTLELSTRTETFRYRSNGVFSRHIVHTRTRLIREQTFQVDRDCFLGDLFARRDVHTIN